MLRKLLIEFISLLCWLIAFRSKRNPEYRASKYHVYLNETDDAEKFFRKIWDKETMTKQESVYAIFVDDECQVIDWVLLHKGGKDKCFIDMHLLFEFALKYQSKRMFIAHNHPRGSLKNLDKDIARTSEICLGAKSLKYEILDHIIITATSRYSFKEYGIIC